MKKKNMVRYGLIGVLAVVIIVALVYFFSGTGVKVGDKVKIDYTGYLEDGKVFDTSIKDVAEKNNIFNANRPYEPLEFTLGNKEVIKGMEEGILGMSKGSKKTIVIQPQDGYGEFNQSLVKEVPLSQEINRTVKIDEIVEVPKEQFNLIFNKDPILNDKINSSQVPWPLEVVEIGEVIKIKNNPMRGENYLISGTPWNSSYEGIDGDKLIFIQNPENGMIIQNAFGNVVVTVNDDKIKLVQNPIIGRETQYGKVVNVTDKDMLLDMNHPLAGKVLRFEVILVDVVKATPSLDNFVKCLTEKGAKFYGTGWCPHCKEQKELFGDSLKYVNYIECDAGYPNAQPQLCDQNNIKGYPTWIINGEQYSGVQTLDKLAELTDCKLN